MYEIDKSFVDGGMTLFRRGRKPWLLLLWG